MDVKMNWPLDSFPKELGCAFLTSDDFPVYRNIPYGNTNYPELKAWLNLQNKQFLEESLNGTNQFLNCRAETMCKTNYSLGILNGNILINSDDGLRSGLESQLSKEYLSNSDTSDSDGEKETQATEVNAGFADTRRFGANAQPGSVRDAQGDVRGQGDAEDIPNFHHSASKHGQLSSEPPSMADIMGFQNRFDESQQLCNLLESHVSLKSTDDCTRKNRELQTTFPAPKKRLDPTETRPTHYVESSSSEDEDESTESYKHRLQRSTSLKTGKTPPGTPGRKKIVRFADALGLDLARVRTFLDGIPNVPSSAYRDLNTEDLIDNSSRGFSQIAVNPVSCSSKSLISNFTLTPNLPSFVEKLKFQKVCLENAAMVESMTIRGVVRCLNIDFHKTVVIRSTTDGWKTFRDTNAAYVVNSCDGLSDKFSFILYNQSLQPGEQVAFAVCYRVAGQEFWDNNNGDNFVFQCINVSVPKATCL